MLREVPLGQYRLEIGLKLRETMLSGTLLGDGEVLHLPSDKMLLKLEQIGEYLLVQLIPGRA